jgi:hypothetical protein
MRCLRGGQVGQGSSTSAPYSTSAARGAIELVWGNLEEPDDRHGEEKQLSQTVPTVELLLHGEVIIDEELHCAPIICINYSRVYRNAAPKNGTPAKHLPIPA